MKKTLILIVVFLVGCQGGKRVSPSSSGAVKIIKTSESPPPKAIKASELTPKKEHQAMNVIPKGSAVEPKPKVKTEN